MIICFCMLYLLDHSGTNHCANYSTVWKCEFNWLPEKLKSMLFLPYTTCSLFLGVMECMNCCFRQRSFSRFPKPGSKYQSCGKVFFNKLRRCSSEARLFRFCKRSVLQESIVGFLLSNQYLIEISCIVMHRREGYCVWKCDMIKHVR